MFGHRRRPSEPVEVARRLGCLNGETGWGWGLTGLEIYVVDLA